MKKIVTLTLLALFLSACVPVALFVPRSNPALAQARQATARDHDLDAALADGFEPLFECIEHGDMGAMGFHYINPQRVDGTLILTEPEVLMYEEQADGSMDFVGVEYIVFESDWTEAEPPVFLGQTLARKTSVGPNEVPPFYEVHAWLWRYNPSGTFADWNPDVTCR